MGNRLVPQKEELLQISIYNLRKETIYTKNLLVFLKAFIYAYENFVSNCNVLGAPGNERCKACTKRLLLPTIFLRNGNSTNANIIKCLQIFIIYFQNLGTILLFSSLSCKQKLI